MSELRTVGQMLAKVAGIRIPKLKAKPKPGPIEVKLPKKGVKGSTPVGASAPAPAAPGPSLSDVGSTLRRTLPSGIVGGGIANMGINLLADANEAKGKVESAIAGR